MVIPKVKNVVSNVFNKRAAKGSRKGYRIRAWNERALIKITSYLRWSEVPRVGVSRRKGRGLILMLFKRFRNEKGRWK